VIYPRHTEPKVCGAYDGLCQRTEGHDGPHGNQDPATPHGPKEQPPATEDQLLEWRYGKQELAVDPAIEAAYQWLRQERVYGTEDKMWEDAKNLVAAVDKARAEHAKPFMWITSGTKTVVERKAGLKQSHTSMAVRIDRRDDYYTIPLYTHPPKEA
jgi:hypothetical protein